ncbi:sulfur carrier protein ThiS [Undibacterium sp. RTI2.1]|uniref:sulfur carrier protein ThiS n=1 Tax=unclassified Undibacterium TaxID=2630295 RepID=UPI002AB4C321|nr:MULTISPECIES: sulfur carrier protein ThiS [unclassified Undibacterium]MDY7539224.1 sulfur carrier protein ThiS [Undibacterium sp. 5I1]MEB0031076.1 sulfur carrier protein ThiS [Undibacterium sp. RTI2.1]MEB0116237.1 sulfur carrier protein ThiS [Undibacterium sp. RTI2.2]MEB0231104.1 sulfur carrier protein ThiS [Undibacterium sp. 10I3]MEB0256977.1 sulfur carrier protein ThiS [Undibacterium sp. 5I1]
MTPIVLNGEPYQFDRAQTLAGLIETLNLSGQAIAVAVNRQIVARSHWSSYYLQAQDQVDVVRAIGGG